MRGERNLPGRRRKRYSSYGTACTDLMSGESFDTWALRGEYELPLRTVSHSVESALYEIAHSRLFLRLSRN